MNKTDLLKAEREEMKRKQRVHKHLPHGKLMNYDCLLGNGVGMRTVNTFKEFLWQLARFGEDVEICHYNLFSPYFSVTYRVYPDRENELDEFGDPWCYNVSFYIRYTDHEDVKDMLDKLGIECKIEERTSAASTRPTLVCTGS